MKQTIRRMLTWMVALVLLLGMAAAFAQEDAEPAKAAITANATVIAPKSTYVTAPFSGTLLPFSWSEGDVVQRGETLVTMDTVKVYASSEGTLSAMFAKAGDDAQGVINRYGSLCVVEPTHPYFLEASTSGASKGTKNKFLHAGQTLYLKEGDEKGEGRVMSVSQETYQVEILDGDYEMGDSVKCYRESGYATDSVTGTGTVRRFDDVAVQASGRVLAVHKQEGDTVAAGDLLFEMIDAASQPSTATCDVVAAAEGAITALHVLPGAQVYQGQLLCQVADLSQLELSIEVDEVDLALVQEGGMLSFTLDAFPDREFQGTVTTILPIGTSRQNAAYFDVRVTLPVDAGILPGMNATVLLER